MRAIPRTPAPPAGPPRPAGCRAGGGAGRQARGYADAGGADPARGGVGRAGDDDGDLLDALGRLDDAGDVGQVLSFNDAITIDEWNRRRAAWIAELSLHYENLGIGFRPWRRRVDPKPRRGACRAVMTIDGLLPQLRFPAAADADAALGQCRNRTAKCIRIGARVAGRMFGYVDELVTTPGNKTTAAELVAGLPRVTGRPAGDSDLAKGCAT